MAILSKGCKPDNFESKNSPKLSLRNIWGLCSNFVDFESFLESHSFKPNQTQAQSGILALCEISLDGSIDFGKFSVRGYLPLIRKDSTTYVHGLSVYVKEGLPFAWDLSLENAADSYLCFQLTEVKVSVFPGGNFMPKFNNRNTRTGCTICSKLTMKTLKWYQTLFLCLYC